ncbi:MAG: hypothetical protein ABH864_03480 [archaeon]
MSKRKRQKEKQERAAERAHGRNAIRKRNYANMAQNGIRGAAEKARGRKKYAPPGSNGEPASDNYDAAPRSLEDNRSTFYRSLFGDDGRY